MSANIQSSGGSGSVDAHRLRYTADLAPIHLLRRRYCLFVGAGFSAEVAGYKNVADLKQILLNEIDDVGFGVNDTDPLTMIAEAFHVSDEARIRLLHILRQHFGRNGRGDVRIDTARLLTDIAWRAIYTTNYDSFIEDTLAKAGTATRVVTRNSDVARLRKYELPIYKLHGSTDELTLDEETPLVISERDYLDDRYWRNREILFHRLQVDLVSFPVLFIGYSIKDDSVRRLWTALFTKLTRVRRERSLGIEPARFFHIALSRDPKPIAEQFWGSHGIQVRAQDIHQFATAVLDYQDKAFAGTNTGGFDERQFLLARSAARPCSATYKSLPMHTADFLERLATLADLSFSNPGKMFVRLQTIADKDGPYVATALGTELKLPDNLRKGVAIRLHERLLAELDLRSGQAVELAVSAIRLLWDTLDEDAAAVWAQELVALFKKADKLTLFKVAQTALEVNHSGLSHSIFRFCYAHRDDGANELLDPERDSPVSRLLRQLIYSLVSVDPGNVTFDRDLLDLFQTATNPVVAWEIGAVLAARCLWQPSCQTVVLSWLSSLSSPNDALREAYLFGRLPSFLKEKVPPQVADVLTLRTQTLATAIRRDTADRFEERLAFFAATQSVTTSDDWLQLARPYLDEIALDQTAAYSVALSLPAAARTLPREQRIKAFVAMIQRAPRTTYIAQPALQFLSDDVSKTQSKDALAALEACLALISAHRTFEDDEWARYVCVQTLGGMLRRNGAALPASLVTACHDILHASLRDPNERLTVAASAFFGLRGDNDIK